MSLSGHVVGTPQAGSDIGSEGDGVPSEISDSTANVEDTSPDIKVYL